MADTIADLHAEAIAEVAKVTDTPVMYNLGAGQNPEPGFLGLDFNMVKSDAVHPSNLFEFPWRDDGTIIPAGSVDYLTSSHFVEHVPDWSAHFAEAYRVLKVGGFYKLTAPYHTSDRADQDPDHKQRVLEARFMYLNREWLHANKIDHCNADVNFSVFGGTFFYAWSDAWRGRDPATLLQAKQQLRNVVDDIAVILRKEE